MPGLIGGLDRENKSHAQTICQKYNLFKIQHTVGSVTIFNKKPNLTELKKIWSVDQPSNENAGLAKFKKS